MSGPGTRRVAAVLVVCLLANGCGMPDALQRATASPPALLCLYYADVSMSMQAGADERRREEAVSLLEQCAARQATFVATFVDGDLESNPHWVSISLAPDESSGNPILAGRARDRLLDTAREQLDVVLTAQPRNSRGTDLLGALRDATRRLRAHEGDGWIVLHTDAYHQTDELDLLGADLAPEGVEASLERLDERDLLPDLRGARVDVAGVGLTEGGGRPAEEAIGLERFWRALVHRSGGELGTYGRDLQVNGRAPASSG